MVRMIEVTHFTDPGCPWAYSASPALATLRWRYGDQLRWTLVTIGLAEDPSRYEKIGYTPKRSAIGYTTFRKYGMPFQVTPKASLSATSPACRAIVATRLAAPELEYAAFRALQRLQFTTTGLFDDAEALRYAWTQLTALTRRRLSPQSTRPRRGRPTRPTAPAPAPPPGRRPSSRSARPTATGRCATRRRR